MRFNVNDEVKVRLTAKGRAIHQEYFDNLYEKDAFASSYTPPKEDKDGWSRWQLHELMHIWGNALCVGRAMPFNAEIEIPEQEEPMVVTVKLGKHFQELSEKYKKIAKITKHSGGNLTIAFIPYSPNLQFQLNHVRNSGQVESDNWKGIEHGLVTMKPVGVLPADELVAAIRADMEELGYTVEIVETTGAVNNTSPSENTIQTAF